MIGTIYSVKRHIHGVRCVKLSEAFKETMFRYGLVAKQLAAQSRLNEGQISQFRNGGHLRSDSLDRLIAAMPIEARQYMLHLVVKEDSNVIPLPQEAQDQKPEADSEPT